MFALMPVFAFWCLRFWCVRSPWGGGAIIVPPPPLPRLLACVLTLWCGLEKRVRCSLGCGVTVMGRDMIVPPHALLGGAAAVACAWKERRLGVGCPLGVVNITPRSLLCSPTWKRVAALLVLNKEGEPPAGRGGLAGGGVCF